MGHSGECAGGTWTRSDNDNGQDNNNDHEAGRQSPKEEEEEQSCGENGPKEEEDEIEDAAQAADYCRTPRRRRAPRPESPGPATPSVVEDKGIENLPIEKVGLYLSYSIFRQIFRKRRGVSFYM